MIHTTSWHSGGDEKTLITTCRDDEGEDACLTRHNDDLAFFQTVYPVDP